MDACCSFSPSFNLQPANVHSQEVNEIQKFKKDVEDSNSILKTIKVAAICLSAACLVGIWAFPLKLVMYSGVIKALSIPVTLLVMPLVLVISAVVGCIFGRQNVKLTQDYHNILLKNILEKNDFSDKTMKEFKEASHNIRSLDLMNLVNDDGDRQLKLTLENFDLLLNAAPFVNIVLLDATYLEDGFLNVLIEKLKNVKQIHLRSVESIPESLHKSFAEHGFSIEYKEGLYLINKKGTKNYCSSSISDDYLDYYVDMDDHAYHDESGSGGDISFAFEWD